MSSYGHLYNSSINTMKPNTHTGGMMPHSQTYLRLFFILKGQRSMIDSIIPTIKETLYKEPEICDNPSEMSLIHSLEELVSKLQNATLGTLYPISNEVVQELHNNFLTKPLLPMVYKFVIRALKACLTITRNLSLILIDIQNISKILPPPSPINVNIGSAFKDTKNDEEEEDEYIVCRICDQKVKSSLFEEHTESCMMAYKNEAKLSSINSGLLEIQKIIINQLLNEPWPGVRETAIAVLLPTLHASILLNRAFEIDPHSSDSSEELQCILISLDFFTHMTLPSETNLQIVQLRAKVNEKRMASNAIREAEYILSKTRFKPDDQPILSYQTTIADFHLIKPISSGAFARVFLAKKKQTGDIYAIKVQPKDDVIQKNQVKRVMAEKDILLQFNNPYIINFYYSFVGQHNLYIVMEYLPGGDLYSLLQHLFALEENPARIYTIQIAKAIGYLHSRNIIHRDIKPDNILIAADGTLKLTDFGLSYIGCVNRQVNDMNAPRKPLKPARSLTTLGKEVSSLNTFRNRNNSISNLLPQINENMVESKSLVGTPDYIAPEIILNLPHTFTVDWWSLGVMVYEFITGVPPFHGETVEETRDLIVKGRYRRLTMEDDDVSEDCADFIDSLLQQNQKKRLGAKGLEEVLNHKWLKGFDIEKYDPPFVPELNSELDTTYFEERNSSTEKFDDDIFDDINQANKQRELQKQMQEKEIQKQIQEKELQKQIQENEQKEEQQNQQFDINLKLKSIHSKIRRHSSNATKSSESSLSGEDLSNSTESFPAFQLTGFVQNQDNNDNSHTISDNISSSNSNFSDINTNPIPSGSFVSPFKMPSEPLNRKKYNKQIGSLGSFSSFGSFSGNSNESSPLQSSSFLLSSECGDDLSAQSNPSDEMSAFPSVSVEQLGNTNRQLSLMRRKSRPRATSFIVDDNNNNNSPSSLTNIESSPVSVESDSPIASKNFIGLNPVAGTRRRGRRQSSFLPCFSSFDDFKKITMTQKPSSKTNEEKEGMKL